MKSGLDVEQSRNAMVVEGVTFVEERESVAAE
jgi:hypothetical protein